MPLKICLVALHAYPVIDPTAAGVFGGTETRAWTIAQGLAKLPDVEVTFVVRNPKLKSARVVDGIKIIPKRDWIHLTRNRVAECIELTRNFPYIKLRRWNWMLPCWIIFLLITKPFRSKNTDPRLPDIFYQKIAADVMCTFGVHSTAATVISSSQQTGKRSVLFLGADSDLDERFTPNSDYITPYNERAAVCYFALKQADFIVAQKTYQLLDLKNRFNREGWLFLNPIDVSQWQTQAANRQKEWLELLNLTTKGRCPTNYVLWIGRAEKFHKRANLMLELAIELTDIPFLMIMNERDPDIEREVLENKPKNLHVIKSVPFNLMPAVFDKARLFVNTSSAKYEGFPNTFIQAGSLGVPVLSLETAPEFFLSEIAGKCYHGDMTELMKGIIGEWRTPHDPKRNNKSISAIKNLHDTTELCMKFVKELQIRTEIQNS